MPRRRVSRRPGRALLCGAALASVVVLTGCARGCTSSQPPVHLNPSMDNQPKVRPQAASTFFYDGASMREPVPGTVAIGGLREDAAFFTGKGADGQFVAAVPYYRDDSCFDDGTGSDPGPRLPARARPNQLSGVL